MHHETENLIIENRIAANRRRAAEQAPSALPPSEPQGACERSRLATCSADVVPRLREHANRVAGGWASDPNYDPETLEIEHDAADEIERLRAALIFAASWIETGRTLDGLASRMREAAKPNNVKHQSATHEPS